MGELVELAREIILMRKYPLKNQGAQRYPAAAQRFATLVDACADRVVLREIVRLDTGHVLPTATKQRVYEKLLADETQRTPDLLNAFALHLIMFGYMGADGVLVHDTDDLVHDLQAEASAKSNASNANEEH